MVEGYSVAPKNPEKIHEDFYCYLPRPSIVIEPTGRIKITFGQEWSAMDKENFLQDMKVKVLKKDVKR